MKKSTEIAINSIVRAIQNSHYIVPEDKVSSLLFLEKLSQTKRKADIVFMGCGNDGEISADDVSNMIIELFYQFKFSEDEDDMWNAIAYNVPRKYPLKRVSNPINEKYKFHPRMADAVDAMDGVGRYYDWEAENFDKDGNFIGYMGND